MHKKQIINMLPITVEQSTSLFKKKSIDDLIFTTTFMVTSEGGFHTDTIVFTKGESFYLFRAIEYMDGHYTFTTPFEVFPELVKEREYTTYTTWVDDPDGWDF